MRQRLFLKASLWTALVAASSSPALALLDQREVVGNGYGYTGCHSAAAWYDLWAPDNKDYYCVSKKDGTYTLMVFIDE